MNLDGVIAHFGNAYQHEKCQYDALIVAALEVVRALVEYKESYEACTTRDTRATITWINTVGCLARFTEAMEGL